MSSFAERKDPVRDLFLAGIGRVNRYLETGKGTPSRFTPKQLQAALNKRPYLRTRTTGVVGPELDWSVVYSDVYRAPVLNLIHEFKKPPSWGPLGLDRTQSPGWMFPHPGDFGGEKADVRPPAKHGCFSVATLTDKESVIRWTHFANTVGIEFDGKRGYRYPDHILSNGEVRPADYFRDLKAEGLTIRHRRDPRSLIRKLRKLSKKGLKKAFIPSLVPKMEKSSFQRRKEWREATPRCSWSEFQRLYPNKVVGTCFSVKGRPTVPVKGPAYEALSKLRSIKPVKVYALRSDLLDWTKPKPFTQVANNPPPREEIKDRDVRIPRLQGSFLRFGKVSNMWKGPPSHGTIPFINDEWMQSSSIFNRAESQNRRNALGPDAENYYSRFKYTLGGCKWNWKP